MTGQIASAVATALGALIAGWFAVLAKRTQQKSPETVAGGYSKLVDDMRRELERLGERVATLEQDGQAKQQRIRCLERKIGWLTDRISDQDRVEFDKLFPRSYRNE